MKRIFPGLVLALVVLLMLAACDFSDQSRSGQPTEDLPAPQVRVEFLPSATPPPATLTATVEPPTLTPEPVVYVQPLPTLDDSQYLVDQVESLLNDITRSLDQTDTRLKP